MVQTKKEGGNLLDKILTKSDIAVYFGAATVVLFLTLVAYIFFAADVEVLISGTLDPNTLVVIFLALVNAVFIFLGIKKTQN